MLASEHGGKCSATCDEPVGECLTFGKLIEEGADVEGVARQFGLTIRFVDGRLRLASLAPEIFENWVSATSVPTWPKRTSSKQERQS